MEITYKLSKPLLLNFAYDDVPRDEMITHITVGVRIGEADAQEIDACRSLYSRIDMTGREPFTLEELSAFDVSQGLRDAYQAAASRARAFCRAKVELLEQDARTAARTGAPDRPKALAPVDRPYLVEEGQVFGLERRQVPPPRDAEAVSERERFLAGSTYSERMRYGRTDEVPGNER